MWGVKLPVIPRSGRDFYIFVVIIRLTSACPVGGTQYDTRKKICILICVFRSVKFGKVVYREEVLPGGKQFRYCSTQIFILLQAASKKSAQSLSVFVTNSVPPSEAISFRISWEHENLPIPFLFHNTAVMI